MREKIKSLAGDSLVYGLSTILTRFITVFLVPIYTRIFSPSDYGLMNLVNTTMMLAGVMVILGLDNAATRWYWDRQDSREREVTFSSWFWSQVIWALFISTAISLSSLYLSEQLTGNDNAWPLFVIAAVNLPFTSFILVYTSWLRVQRKALPVTIFSLVNTILTISLSVFLVVYRREGLAGVFLAQLISNVFCALVAIALLSRHISFRLFSASRVVEMLKFSLPLVPATLAFWLMNSAGSLIINAYATKAEVGLYQVGSSIAAFSAMIFWAFLQAWSPFAMSISNTPEAGRSYSVVFDLYCGVGSVVVLFVCLFAPEIVLILTTRDYAAAAPVAGLLSINVLIANIAQITFIGAAIMKKSKFFLHGVLLSAVLTCGMFFLLVPFFGKEGAAISTITGSCFLAIYVSIKSQAINHVPYNFRKNIFLLALLIICCAFAMYLASKDILKILPKLFIFFSFIAFVWFVNRTDVHRLFRRRLVVPSVRVEEKQ